MRKNFIRLIDTHNIGFVHSVQGFHEIKSKATTTKKVVIIIMKNEYKKGA